MNRYIKKLLLLLSLSTIYFYSSAQLIQDSRDTLNEVILRSNDEKEVVVRASSKKNRPLNELSIVSARAFSVEEARRYAAAVNDPLRMATAFPGVTGTSDGQNNISIRGNAPNALLWRMEGVDIPNPNHFSSPGSAGGGISILSAQLLANSDFVTGAFAAEYGNTIGGVFDLRLRKGNSNKREYTVEAGLLGLNFAAEGPIASFYQGSYLINYRYSTLSLLSKLGLNIGSANTDFQDLSYNIYLPTARKGKFTIFGFMGLSNQTDNPIEREKWESDFDRYSGKFVANTILNGITHTLDVNENISLRSALSLANSRQKYNQYYTDEDNTSINSFKDNNISDKITLNSTLNYKIDQRQLLRAGIIASSIHFNYYQLSRENPIETPEERINVKGNTQTIQGFAQWQFKPVDNITVNSGFHYLHLLLNNTSSIEPRASIKWDMNDKNAFTLGYGLHSQIQGMGVYFFKQHDDRGNIIYPNKNLDLIKSNHFVAGYNRVFNKHLRFKAEVYYQHLFNVPVSDSDTSTFSSINIEGGYVPFGLVGKGKGKNYGIELSLEKSFSNNFYYMINTSFYQSKYKALDGIERNTAFNGNKTFNVVAGKDFIAKSKSRIIGVNIKSVYAGGFRTTPIDLDQSKLQGYAVYIELAANSIQNPAYFRTDLRASVKWLHKRSTSTLSLDVQNVMNRTNIYTRIYDAMANDYKNIYQAGLIPVINYKIEF